MCRPDDETCQGPGTAERAAVDLLDSLRQRRVAERDAFNSLDLAAVYSLRRRLDEPTDTTFPVFDPQGASCPDCASLGFFVIELVVDLTAELMALRTELHEAQASKLVGDGEGDCIVGRGRTGTPAKLTKRAPCAS